MDDGEREQVVATVVEVAAGRVPVMAGATSNDTAPRRGRDPANVRARRGRHPHRDALLQQAHAGRPLPPLPRRRRRLDPPGLPLQRPRPHRRQPRPGHRARARRAPEHRRHQGGERRPAPDHGDHPPPARWLRGALGRRLARLSGGRRRRRRAHLGHVERGAGADDGAGAPRARRATSTPPAAAQYRLLPLMDANFLETNPSPVKAGLALLGRIRDVLRLPLVPASAATRDALRSALAAAGAHVR